MDSGNYGNTVTGEDSFSDEVTGGSEVSELSLVGRRPPQQNIAGSWLQTVQSLMGTRSHKPSFVLFDIGQSGCITLAKWFEAHPAITFQEDILSETVRFPRLSVYQRIRQSNTDVYGFSLTVEQLRQVQRLADPNQFLQDLNRGGCRVVYLNRRDVLRHAIATLRTYSVNCRFDGKDTTRSNQLTIDVSELLACLKYLDNQRVEASAILHDIPCLELVYEDDLMDPNTYAQTADRLSAFLNIEDIKPVGSSLKLVHQRLCNIVENYEEVRAGLEASEYAYLLTDNRHLLTI
ncbi:MAG: hypothetical protein AAFV85_10725 [Cyanobacteria bacterium J06634_6]